MDPAVPQQHRPTPPQDKINTVEPVHIGNVTLPEKVYSPDDVESR
jgi:hypothetical protein